jgi:predicted membrane GTPase involved in stress response
VKSLAFCFLCSDNKDTKRDAATAPSVETMAVDEPSLQEVDPVVKSPKAPKAPGKKVVATRGSKRLKKSTDAGVSLETHRSTSSSDDVSVDTGVFAFVSCVIFILMYFFWLRS